MQEKTKKFLFIFLRSVLWSLLIIIPSFLWLINTKIYYPIKKVDVVYVKKQDVYFTTKDNVKLSAWYVKAKQGQPTIIFCHGNGGNVSYFQDFVDFAENKGYGILALDYRGYGNSSGKPNEKGLYTDLKTAVNYLKTKENIKENDIILWGLSLGGAVVAQVASEDSNFKGVILQSTFTNVKDMVSNILHKSFLRNNEYKGSFIYPIVHYIPVSQEFDTKSKINKIKSPLLLGHAVPDSLIPYKMSVELAKLNPNAKLFISEKGEHNEFKWFFPKANEFIESLR